jgi:hypothetical protein
MTAQIAQSHTDHHITKMDMTWCGTQSESALDPGYKDNPHARPVQGQRWVHAKRVARVILPPR